MRKLSLIRRLTQCAVILGLCLVPWLNANGMHGVSGNLFGLDVFGWPFADPAAFVQAAAGGGFGWNRLAVGAASSLVLALILGRAFCGWICPYGLLSETVAAIHRSRGQDGAPVETPNAQREWGMRTGVLLAGVFLAALGIPFLAVISFPGELSLLPAALRQTDGVSVGLSIVVIPCMVLCAELLSGRRLWCRHVCPQGLLLGCAAWAGERLRGKGAPGLRIDWNAASCSCKGDSPCARACTLAVLPRRRNGPDAGRCVVCGDCVDVCASHGGALRWRGTAPKSTFLKRERC